MSFAAPRRGAAAAAASSSSSAAVAITRYYFCYRCFFVTAHAVGAACPLCGGAFDVEITIPRFEAPNPSLYYETGLLRAFLASFVLRYRADALAFFRSEIPPLRHLTRYPAQRPPFPLAYLGASIDHLLIRGPRVYVVFAGAPLPPPPPPRPPLTVFFPPPRILLPPPPHLPPTVYFPPPRILLPPPPPPPPTVYFPPPRILPRSATAATSSSSAAPATNYYFCHRCFVSTALAAGEACPLCDGAFVEEINNPPLEVPNPNRNHRLYYTTGCLSNSPASFVLCCNADIDAFFCSEISPVRHLTVHPAQYPPLPLANLEESIVHLVARGSRAYVVLAGVKPLHDIAPSDLEIDQLADEIDYEGRRFDTFITQEAGPVVAALRDVEIDEGQLCAVCLETLEIGTVAAGFLCTHVFHRNCIVPWLQRQDTCPVCRFSPLTEEMTERSDTVFRVIIPPLMFGLDLDLNILVLEQNVRGDPEIPPSQWA